MKIKSNIRKRFARALAALGLPGLACRAAGLAPVAGGEVAVPQHPLAPPTLSGNRITVDLMLNQPTRVTRMIMDLTRQRFIADRVFSNAGQVTGGAVVYDQATANEIYPTRDVQEIVPGTEFPLVTDERHIPKIAPVRKWGGKTYVLDEARDRNNTTYFTNQVRKIANAIVRKINARCVEVLEAAVAEHSRVVTGNDWGSVVTVGTSPTPSADTPLADFTAAWLDAETRELGVVYDTWIVNPIQLSELMIAYGDKLPGILQANGIREMYASNRVAAGTAYAVASGQVGEMRVEKPLYTVSWREEGSERTWVQSGVRPVMYVTDPFSVLKFTGL